MGTAMIRKKGGVFDLGPLREWARETPDGLYRVEIRRVRRLRSGNQNAWLWGCVYPMLLQALNAQGWEFASAEQVHELFKRQLASQTVVNRATGEMVTLPSSTALMSAADFSAYCDKLRDYASEYLGVDIPDPE